EFYRRFEIEHLVCTWLTRASYGQPGFVGILLTRTARQGDFSARQLIHLQAVLPALSSAVNRGVEAEAQRRERHTLEAILAADEHRPVLAFDVCGTLLWCSPSAASGLGPVPDDLRAAVRRLGDMARGRVNAIPVLSLSCRATKQMVRASLTLAS